MADRPTGIVITREMIEAGGRCVRAHFGLGDVSFSESEVVAEEVLRAALRPPATQANVSRRSRS